MWYVGILIGLANVRYVNSITCKAKSTKSRIDEGLDTHHGG